MRQKVGWDDVTPIAQLPHGAVEIDGVPVHDRRRDQAEAGRAEALVFEGAVADLALPVEEHRAERLPWPANQCANVRL